jgi:hypothetical protein
MSRDSSVGVATEYGLDGRDLMSGKGKRFSLLNSVQTGSGAHAAADPMGTYRGLFPPGGKPARE